MIEFKISFDDYLKMCDVGFWEWMREQEADACTFRVDPDGYMAYIATLPDEASAVAFKLRWM